MRYFQILREMSRSEAESIWRKHGADPTADLKPAWKNLLRKAHPDAGGNLEDAKLINAAYDVLKNPNSGRGTGASDWRSETDEGGDYNQERPRRQRNWYYNPNQDAETERNKTNSKAKWSWAGYSGGMHNDPTIRTQDYTDVNYIKKRMWELSGESTEEWTIWGFDGNYLRGVTTVYGSPKIFAHMAEAMITWQTKGGNPYACRAVLVEKDEKHRSKPYIDDDEDEHGRTVYVIWADGVFYDKKPIPLTYETFNANPGNDQSFRHRLRKLIDDLQEQGGRSHEQDSMHTPGGSDNESASFETGAYVVHPKYGVGRVVNPEVRKGMIRVIFKDKHGEMKTGNVKASSLQPASRRDRWHFEHGKGE
jgi:hypothetical protein